MEIFFKWFWELLYTMQKYMCFIIDFVTEIFYKLGGIDSVELGGEKVEILSHFLSLPKVKFSFLAVLIIGIILLFVFTMISIGKMNFSDIEKTRSKSGIIFLSLQSLFMILVIPFILLAFIYLSNTIMQSINIAMSGSENLGRNLIGGGLLVVTGNDAYIGDQAIRENIEFMFITGELDYMNIGTVMTYYDISKINYLVGILGSLIIMVAFCMSAIIFILRIFDVVMLYIISPIPISTYPLDNGERYKQLKNLLISKILGAYGIILAMNLFFMLEPVMANIKFFDDNFKNGVVKLLFIIGGAFATTRANIVISNLTGGGNNEAETRELINNISTGNRMAKGTAIAVGGALATVLGGRRYAKSRRQGYTIDDIMGYYNREEGRKNDSRREFKKSEKSESIAKSKAKVPYNIMRDFVHGGVIGGSKNIRLRMEEYRKNRDKLRGINENNT